MNSGIYQEDLAYIHDVGFGDLAHVAAPAVVRTLRSRGLNQGRVVELGCGSGLLLAALSDAGYRTIGIDSSEEMLRLAEKKAPEAELRCQSLYDAVLPSCQAVVAVGEPLNYETGAASNLTSLPALINRVFEALTKGGLFLFDLILQLPETVRQYRTWESGADWSVLVEVLPGGPDVITRRIITFRNVGSGYRRSEETHRVRLFRREDVEGLLIQAGFSVRIRDAYGEAPLLPGRLVFEASKGGQPTPTVSEPGA